MTALKATKLAEEHNFNIHDTEGFDPCESDRNSCPNNTPLFAFQPITTGDVHKIIKSLPSNKASCCDKVNAKILKDSSPVIAPIITSLINNSFFFLSTFNLLFHGRKQKSFQFLSPGTVNACKHEANITTAYMYFTSSMRKSGSLAVYQFPRFKQCHTSPAKWK